MPNEITYVNQEMSYAVAVQKANFDTQIEAAQKYKRNMSFVQDRIFSLATLDTETAQDCIYALPRGGKTIEGASIRFAEIVKAAYGNCRVATQILEVNRKEGFIVAQAIFEDIEANTTEYETVRRRIMDKYNKLYNEDLLILHCNVACSIARRNVILKAIPKPLWNKAYQAVQKTLGGEQKPLEESRKIAIEAMLNLGISKDRLLQRLGVQNESELSHQNVNTLRNFYKGIKNGDLTIEDLLYEDNKPTKSLIDIEENKVAK